MNRDIIQEEIIRGCGQLGIEHVCVKKLWPRKGKVRFSKRWIAAAMPGGDYWAGREMDLINLLNTKRVPHVVELLSYSKGEQDRTEVVTFDAGWSLDEWLDRTVQTEHGQYPHPFYRVEEYLKLLRACLVALKALHGRGFVHCDIKADNICLPATDEDADGWRCLDYTKLTLIDFAFSISAELPLDRCLPIDWEKVTYLSKPMRRALEQDHRRGKPNQVEEIDYSADLYSLGVMAESFYSQGVAWPEGRKIRGADIDALLDRFGEFAGGLSWRMRRSGKGVVHDDLIKRIDRLLSNVKNTTTYSCRFRVVAAGSGARTPPTPVTPVVADREEATKKADRDTASENKVRGEPIAEKPPEIIEDAEQKRARTKKIFRAIGFAGVGILAVVLIGFGVDWLMHRPETVSNDPFERNKKALVNDLASSSPDLCREAAKKLFGYVRDDHAKATQVWESQSEERHQQLESKPADEAALAVLKTMAHEEAQYEESGVRPASEYLADYEQALIDSHESMSATEYWKSEGKTRSQPEGWNDYVARLRAAASTGDRYAAVWLASLEDKGSGVKQDRADAFKQLFYVQNHTDDNPALHQASRRQIGALLKTVRIEKDEQSMQAIISEMERLEAQNDDPSLQLWLGAFYWDLDNKKQARHWYEKASGSTDSEVSRNAEHALQLLAGQ